MSLDYRLTDIEDWEAKCWVPELGTDGEPSLSEDGKPLYRLNPVTDSLVWALMAIRKSRITKANAHEVFCRLAAYEGVMGSFLMKKNKPRPLTFTDVRDHIGLATNVLDETNAQFMKKLVATAKRDYKELT